MAQSDAHDASTLGDDLAAGIAAKIDDIVEECETKKIAAAMGRPIMNRNVRKRRVVLAGLVCSAPLLALSIAFAQAPHVERSAEKAAVAQVFRDYIAAFSEGDTKKIVPYYDVPVALVFPMVARSLATPADTEKWLETVRADMRKRGVESVAIDELNVKILGRSIALLSSNYRRLAKDGKVLERGASTYFLRKTDQGWKISAVTAHPPEDTVKLD